MQGKVAVEEHFGMPETLDDPGELFPERVWKELAERSSDIHDRRLREMDQNGIEMLVLSLNSPAVQRLTEPEAANDLARKANDYLAEQIAKRPDRFQGIAALPLQDPELAAKEMERAAKELGLKGALANGYCMAPDGKTMLLYDQPQYRPFWKVMVDLDLPFYLHPRSPLPDQGKIYEGHSWLWGPAWAFGQETAVQSLRLMASGLFDELPDLQIVIGHLGENLPYSIWRVDNCNAWVESRHNYVAKNTIGHYFQNNFHLTTSGNFRSQTLIDAILEVGSDRIMFATDWPFENIDHAAVWFDAAPISEADRVKIGRSNASRLFKLGLDG